MAWLSNVVFKPSYCKFNVRYEYISAKLSHWNLLQQIVFIHPSMATAYKIKVNNNAYKCNMLYFSRYSVKAGWKLIILEMTPCP